MDISAPTLWRDSAPRQLPLPVGQNLARQQDRYLSEGLDSQLWILRQLIVCISLGKLGKIGDVVGFLPYDISTAGNEQGSDIDQRLSCIAAEESCYTEAIGVDRQLELLVGVCTEREDLVLLDHAREAFKHDLRDIDVVPAHVLPECLAGLLLVDGGADASACQEGIEIAGALNQRYLRLGYLRIDRDPLDGTWIRIRALRTGAIGESEQEDGNCSQSRTLAPLPMHAVSWLPT